MQSAQLSISQSLTPRLTLLCTSLYSYAHLLTLLRPYFSTHLPCCARIPLYGVRFPPTLLCFLLFCALTLLCPYMFRRTSLPCCALTFVRTYPAVTLFFYALTLLCTYFSTQRSENLRLFQLITCFRISYASFGGVKSTLVITEARSRQHSRAHLKGNRDIFVIIVIA